MRLVSRSEQLAAARKRAAADAALKAKAPKVDRAQARAIRQILIENEYRRYILLEDGHYTTKESWERFHDSKRKGLYFCEACYDAGTPSEECWRAKKADPVHFVSPEEDDKPPF